MSVSQAAFGAVLRPANRNPAKAVLHPADWKILAFVVMTVVAAVVASRFRGQAVDWTDFLPDVALGVQIMLIGMLLRKTRFLARTATTLIAFGMIICYLFGIGVLTLTVMPFAFPMVDLQLIAIDGALGFNWHDDVTALAAYPVFATGLRWVYQSILPQIAFVIVLLAALQRDNDLHRFLAVGMLSMTVSMVIWWLWPSVGPAAYAMVSEQVQKSTSLVADAEYGEKMWRYATQGNPVISRASMAGVVAFPSMHIVMMAMVLLFTRKTWAFGPLLMLNATMPMATILQGGHHAVDLVGGMLVFFACVAVVNRTFPDVPGGPGMFHRRQRLSGAAQS